MTDVDMLEGFFYREDVSWMSDALCRQIGGVPFFPEDDGDWQEAWTAQQACLSCPVRWQCLDFAVRHGEHGIWGGTAEAVREQLAEHGYESVPLIVKCQGCERRIPGGVKKRWCSANCKARKEQVAYRARKKKRAA